MVSRCLPWSGYTDGQGWEPPENLKVKTKNNTRKNSRSPPPSIGGQVPELEALALGWIVPIHSRVCVPKPETCANSILQIRRR